LISVTLIFFVKNMTEIWGFYKIFYYFCDIVRRIVAAFTLI